MASLKESRENEETEIGMPSLVLGIQMYVNFTKVIFRNHPNRSLDPKPSANACKFHLGKPYSIVDSCHYTMPRLHTLMNSHNICGRLRKLTFLGFYMTFKNFDQSINQ